MELHHLNQHKAEKQSYLEFLRRPDFSAGVYRLPEGAADPQQPHAEDEIYVMISGHCRFRGGDEDVVVGPGDIIFVPANEPHHFHDIREAIEVVVLFSPPEGTRI